METTPILLTFAELGIVLAGFSGVVLALRRPQDGVLGAEDRARLQDLLITSLSGSMYALFPLLMLQSGMEEKFAMQVSASFLGIFLVIGAVFMLRGGTGRVSRGSVIFIFPSLMVLLLLGLVAFGKLPRSQYFVYFFGLFWLLFLACANFFQLVVGAVGDDDVGETEGNTHEGAEERDNTNGDEYGPSTGAEDAGESSDEHI